MSSDSEHVGERAPAYVAGELPDADRTAIDAHLAHCADCRAELDEVRLAWSAVSAWPRDAAISSVLEDRIVRSVVPRSVWWRSTAVAAAVVGLLCGALGFGAGRLTSGASDGAPAAVAADSSLHSYLLLLEEANWPPAQPLARNGYGAWSRAIASESKFVGAEKLTEEPGFRVTMAGQVARPNASESNYSGWYIVRARSYDEAISWARRGPHLAYGSVLVREIE